MIALAAIVASGLAASAVILALGLRGYRAPAPSLVRDLATWASYALVPVAVTLIIWTAFALRFGPAL